MAIRAGHQPAPFVQEVRPAHRRPRDPRPAPARSPDSQPESRRRLARFPRVRSSTSRRSVDRREPPANSLSRSSGPAWRRPVARRPAIGASGYRRHDETSRGPCRAHRAARDRRRHRTARRAPNRPESHAVDRRPLCGGFLEAARRAACSRRWRRARRPAPRRRRRRASLPPGAAQASSTIDRLDVPASKGTSCEASSCTTNSPAPASAVRSGWPCSTTSPSGAYPVARVSTPEVFNRSASSSRVVRKVFARSVSDGSDC